MSRLPTRVLATALIRRVTDAGGAAMVLARGEPTGGMILALTMDRGVPTGFWERGMDARGAPALVRAGPEVLDPEAADAYWRRRVARDPDLWVVEVDIAAAERFVAETIVTG